MLCFDPVIFTDKCYFFCGHNRENSYRLSKTHSLSIQFFSKQIFPDSLLVQLECLIHSLLHEIVHQPYLDSLLMLQHFGTIFKRFRTSCLERVAKFPIPSYIKVDRS